MNSYQMVLHRSIETAGDFGKFAGLDAELPELAAKPDFTGSTQSRTPPGAICSPGAALWVMNPKARNYLRQKRHCRGLYDLSVGSLPPGNGRNFPRIQGNLFTREQSKSVKTPLRS